MHLIKVMIESRDGGGKDNQVMGEGNNIQIMTHVKCS